MCCFCAWEEKCNKDKWDRIWLTDATVLQGFGVWDGSDEEDRGTSQRNGVEDGDDLDSLILNWEKLNEGRKA